MGTGKAYLAANERSGVALGVTVPSTIVGTSLVEVTQATVSRHLGQVQSTVHTTRQLGDIHVERKLSAGKRQHLVGLLILRQKVDTWGQNGAVISQHVETQAGALRGHTDLSIVLDALHDTVLLAGLGVGACRLIGGISPVSTAELGIVGLVDRMRQRVQNDGRVLFEAATLLSTLIGREPRVDFGLVTDVLGRR